MSPTHVYILVGSMYFFVNFFLYSLPHNSLVSYLVTIKFRKNTEWRSINHIILYKENFTCNKLFGPSTQQAKAA